MTTLAPAVQPTTASAVSRILAKRETRSTSASTRVRGYRRNTRGFTITGRQPGNFIWVEYTDASGALSTGHQERKDAALTRYAKVLTDAGFSVEIVGAGTYNALVNILGKTVPADPSVK